MLAVVLDFTPIEVCGKAIKNCYDTRDKEDTLEKHRKRIVNVGLKLQHKSVLQHLRVIVKTWDSTYIDVFRDNGYATVRKQSNGQYIIAFNMHTLMELPIIRKIEFCPVEYHFLFEKEGEIK